MGTRGPLPKRSDQRRRRNSPTPDKAPTGAPGAVHAPPADKTWHPVAKRWYLSLAKSGQAKFYEPSDWATAQIIAESMSRDLSEQVVGTTESGEILKDTIPLKGASLAAYLKAFSVLLVTEGDRRRAQLELERAGTSTESPEDDRADATVTSIMDRLRANEGA